MTAFGLDRHVAVDQGSRAGATDAWMFIGKTVEHGALAGVQPPLSASPLDGRLDGDVEALEPRRELGTGRSSFGKLVAVE